MCAFGLTSVAAQDATPQAAPSILAGAGLPELKVTITDAGIQAPAEVAAGLSYVTVDNQTDSGADAQFALPPAGTTLEQITQDVQGEGFSDWFYETTFAGGPFAPAHGIGAAVVDLSGGDWIIAVTDSESPIAPVALKVTGDAEATKSGAVPSDLKVTMKGYKFDFPDEVAAGPQVWELTNEDPIAHFIVLLRYPGPVTEKDVQDLLAADMGTPVPDLALNPENFQDGGYVPLHSQGEISWQEVNLTPGTYVALCFVSDKGSQVPHAAMGMFDIFTVPGDVATPSS
jgi:hypothetical protein